jgi:4-hydroxybenzoate polyprenyltransferase
MLHFFKLIRYQNLLLLALMQFIFRYGFLKQQNIWLALSDFQYALLILATVLLAAGGYVINDIFDQETDSKSKPKKRIVGKSISEGTAYNIYAGLTISGVLIGMYLSNVIEKPGFLVLFILIAALLYIYASSLKQMLLVGNLIVALLLGFSIIIIAFFDLFPVTNAENKEIMGLLFSVLKDYALFAFIINFIREIVKDMEDYDGDLSVGMSTLPIVIGIQKTSKIVLGLLILAVLILILYLNKNVFGSGLYISIVYALVLIIAPLIYCMIAILTAKDKKEFGLISKILKLVIFFGIVSIAVITYNMKHNA